MARTPPRLIGLAMSSTKNPENEAEIPAPMPRSLQGGKKAKMAPQPSVPPGLEQDAHGNAIPFEQRTQDDQDMARRGVKDK
jgi:hypothetical protein